MTLLDKCCFLLKDIFQQHIDSRPGPRVYRPGLLRHVTHFQHPGIGKCGTCWPSNRFGSVAYGKVMKSVRVWWMACVPWVEETDNGCDVCHLNYQFAHHEPLISAASTYGTYMMSDLLCKEVQQLYITGLV